ncbi:YncE family protein [Quadrisphaera sp. DSM 44207]|uniref:YncE family protein n=1 Tax=Quadrisphaera sp. DSM 44207 TaxID=1881057 RepID=UPI00087F2E96|nr:YncE family protein [Quadrisphaera sp. DSM 44207]SDQ42315.1 40-residue YVTN family beta-propeller repeat-containing protein [Quadrisphaera sp. DSM 44207]
MGPRAHLLAVALCAGAVLTGCSPGTAPAPGASAGTTSSTTSSTTSGVAAEEPAATAAQPSPVQPPSPPPPPAAQGSLVEVARIGGEISPKSVVATGTGLVVAQNMMYRHTVTVYDRSFALVATIPDEVVLSDFGHPEQGAYRGAPVEAVVTADGRHVYVSNYSMEGPGFREGRDTCSPEDDLPDSFVYRIDTATLRIDQVVRVGAVPKFLELTPDGRTLLVSNWCSYDVSVVDTAAATEVARVPVGRYPRGIAVSPDSRTAHVAVMGSTHLAVLDLATLAVGRVEDVGGGPRHVLASPDGAHLYVTLNRDGLVTKVDAATGETVARVSTGAAPRSAALSADGTALYVVNYESGTVAKVATDGMQVVQTAPVPHHPIGITVDDAARQVWVASYSGTITVLQDGAER